MAHLPASMGSTPPHTKIKIKVALVLPEQVESVISISKPWNGINYIQSSKGKETTSSQDSPRFSPLPSIVRANHFTLLASNNCAHSPFRPVQLYLSPNPRLNQAFSSLPLCSTQRESLGPSAASHPLPFHFVSIETLSFSRASKGNNCSSNSLQVQDPERRVHIFLSYFTSSTHIFQNQFFHLLSFPITAVNGHSGLFSAFFGDFPSLLPPL